MALIGLVAPSRSSTAMERGFDAFEREVKVLLLYTTTLYDMDRYVFRYYIQFEGSYSKFPCCEIEDTVKR